MFEQVYKDRDQLAKMCHNVIASNMPSICRDLAGRLIDSGQVEPTEVAIKTALGDLIEQSYTAANNQPPPPVIVVPPNTWVSRSLKRGVQCVNWIVRKYWNYHKRKSVNG